MGDGEKRIPIYAIIVIELRLDWKIHHCLDALDLMVFHLV